jgi:pimeloyl-ACP methyl ester carboxylesterase
MSKQVVANSKNNTIPASAIVGWASQVAPGLTARWAEKRFLSPRRHRRPDWEYHGLGAGTPFSLDCGGRRIAAWSWGRGPSILLVHGWEGRGSQLSAFTDALVGAGFRVVTFDAPGHGASEGKRSSIVEMAEVLQRLGVILGGVHGIVAHSAGAAATTVAMGSGLSVKKLVYVAPGADVSQFPRAFGRWLGLTPKVVELMQRRIEARFNRKMAELDGHGIAPSMKVPLLIFHDEEDYEVPLGEGTALAKRWPGARLVTTKGLGHRRILRNPEIVSASVLFLSGMA